MNASQKREASAERPGRPPWQRRAISAGAVLAFLAAWEGVSRAELVSPVLLSSPSKIIAATPRLLLLPYVQADLLYTLGSYALSVSLSIVFGVALGLLIGLSETADDVLSPFVAVANSLPKIVLVPVLVLWVGIGLAASVLLATLMGSFPILSSVYAGVKGVDREQVRLARAFGANQSKLFRSILVPSVTPHALAGLRVGVTYAMVGTLIAEFFASSRGLGNRVVAAMSNFEVDAFYVYIALIAFVALGANLLVRLLERQTSRWRPSAMAGPS